MSQEYDIFASVTDYYEKIIDTTFNSESEDLLLSLIHLPKGCKNRVLNAQAQLLGLESLTEKQLLNMPTLIGKHVQAMNSKVYLAVENIITLHWHTIWNPRLLTHGDEQEELIMSFLSSFNGIVAKKIIEEIDNYEMLEMIKMDLLNTSLLNQAPTTGSDMDVVSSTFNWIKNYALDLFRTPNVQYTSSDLEVDFLRSHLSELRTNLLMELHVQFMNFFVMVQSDILEQLSAYYD
ncbi:hypothetical protein BDF21DRAFT_339408 [Thamnidium elegans]|nr:hypothetical protein BDF21DRAFT_339408 [Thamnidium elegans]